MGKTYKQASTRFYEAVMEQAKDWILDHLRSNGEISIKGLGKFYLRQIQVNKSYPGADTPETWATAWKICFRPYTEAKAAAQMYRSGTAFSPLPESHCRK